MNSVPINVCTGTLCDPYHTVCEVKFGEGTAELYDCKVNLDKRRREIARLLLQSKLRVGPPPLVLFAVQGCLHWHT